MDLQIKKFGQFKLLKQIARGGMAEIFLGCAGTLESAHKFVVIKRILLAHSHNKEFNKMFQNEGKIAVNLNHSNIGSIYEFGIENDQYFICMEYISGRNMRQLVKKLKSQKRNLNAAICAYIMKYVCTGLDYAHNCTDSRTGQPLNIIHRDISPQNIMVSFNGDVKVIDFGIAKIDDSESTKVGVLKGKFEYMSPEQARGRPLDRQTDIFSLGNVLWELLAGRKLFVGSNEIQLLKKIRDCQIPDLKKINPDVPDRLIEIVNKALSANKNLRYKTVSELGNDISVFLNKTYPNFTNTQFEVFIKEVYVEEILEERQNLKMYSQALLSTKVAVKGRLLSPGASSPDMMNQASSTFIGYQSGLDEQPVKEDEDEYTETANSVAQEGSKSFAECTVTQTQGNTLNTQSATAITKTEFDDALDDCDTLYTQPTVGHDTTESDGGYRNITDTVSNIVEDLDEEYKLCRTNVLKKDELVSARHLYRRKRGGRNRSFFQKSLVGLFIFGIIGSGYLFRSDIKNYMFNIVQKINQYSGKAQTSALDNPSLEHSSESSVENNPESLIAPSKPSVDDSMARRPTSVPAQLEKKVVLGQKNVAAFGKSVFVTTQPSGAQVYINDESVGRLTPTSVTVPFDGKFKLTLRRTGYYDKTVTLSSGSIKGIMNFPLQKNKEQRKRNETIIIR